VISSQILRRKRQVCYYLADKGYHQDVISLNTWVFINVYDAYPFLKQIIFVDWVS